MSSHTSGNFSLQLFGESHGPFVGVTLDGLPGGMAVEEDALQAFLDRRSPGKKLTSRRRESDRPQIISGVYQGKTTGTPLTLLFANEDPHRGDYAFLPDRPRPGHGDYPAWVHSGGFEDLSGGGHHSGRLTAPYCAAGFFAMKLLQAEGISVAAHLSSMGTIRDEVPAAPDLAALCACQRNNLPVFSPETAQSMEAELEKAQSAGDSLGGTVECFAFGLPAGLGEPYFDNTESLLSYQLFSIPGVKAVEFGEGIQSAALRGSDYNDPYTYKDGRVQTRTNHCGGVLGGMTTGMPLIVRASFRPTASISMEQKTVSLSREQDALLSVQGRHDPCIAVRGVPVVESAVAIGLCMLKYAQNARKPFQEEHHHAEK